jgi:hypothetical protein
MKSASPADPKADLSPPVLPGKSKQRATASNQAFRDSVSKTSAKEAKALVEHCLASFNGSDDDLPLSPELREACEHLSLEATEGFLHDLFHGWQPAIPNFGPKDSRLTLLHTALLERLGKLDPGALRDYPAPSEFHEGWIPVAGFFKGVASRDGERASKLLRAWLPEDNRQLRAAIMGPLVEGWAQSDPSAAWTWLAEARPMEAGWNKAAKGYFAGVRHARWEDYPEKIKAFNRKVSRFEAEPGPLLRQELAKRWIMEDPVAALEYYDKSSSEAKGVIRTEFDPGQREMAGKVIRLSQVVAPWLESDPRCLEKLSELLANTSSGLQGIDPDEVLAAIAFGSSNPADLRAKAKAQIRDLAKAEHLQAERQEAASPTVEWRAGAKGLRSE